jgi:dihydroorotate dehydrogenase electron transfer subunit
MSLYRVSPEEGVVEFLCKATGVGTHTLSGLRMGDELNILGPLGNGFRVDPRWKSIAVVGRGVGLATLAPLAEMAAANGISVTAILSARTKTYIMSQERFLEAGASVENLTDEDGTSSLQNVERILLGLIERKRVDALFTCGSNRLMLLLKRLSKKFDVPGQVALEQQMACGLGMCFCCVRNIQIGDHVEQKRVCHDGPVFTLSEAMSW